MRFICFLWCFRTWGNTQNTKHQHLKQESQNIIAAEQEQKRCMAFVCTVKRACITPHIAFLSQLFAVSLPAGDVQLLAVLVVRSCSVLVSPGQHQSYRGDGGQRTHRDQNSVEGTLTADPLTRPRRTSSRRHCPLLHGDSAHRPMNDSP